VESKESIILRSGLIMGGIVLLALSSMISSVFIAESSKGDAAAINLAGSLRMQSYRIATRLQDAPDDVARQIAAALRASEQAEHRRRLALLEERNAIARELHDSLAQSLSYLKIQVSRLQTPSDRAEPVPESRAIVAELREVLNSAYRQLRELIATFRLKMEHPRLEDNLREAVQEFGRRGDLSIQLDLAGWNATLDAHEQLHVLQIVREALNNAVKHARASEIAVRMRETRHGEVVIEIADNGVGLPDPSERANHFGLHIMRERADHLGGVLSLNSQPGNGLRVRLRFIPAARRRSPNAIDEARYA
jgi:two-component system, NarL family, nitrate/nitrite sensor histidine kinase NarX